MDVPNFKVAPSEIEDVLMKHPHVSEACVIGVPESNKYGSFLPKAFVVLKDSTGNLSPEELMEFSNGDLSL